jgi:hypothetical protein
MDLVGQVEAAAFADRSVNQLARPFADFGLRFLVRALLVIEHEGIDILLSPGEQGFVVRACMTDGDVEHIGFVRIEDGAHLYDERVEPVDRHEVFLQHIGRSGAAGRFEAVDVLRRLIVAPYHRGLSGGKRIVDVLVEELAERIVRDEIQHGEFEPAWPLLGGETVGNCYGLVRKR